jgi:hypothetical protein
VSINLFVFFWILNFGGSRQQESIGVRFRRSKELRVLKWDGGPIIGANQQGMPVLDADF